MKVPSLKQVPYQTQLWTNLSLGKQSKDAPGWRPLQQTILTQVQLGSKVWINGNVAQGKTGSVVGAIAWKLFKQPAKLSFLKSINEGEAPVVDPVPTASNAMVIVPNSAYFKTYQQYLKDLPLKSQFLDSSSAETLSDETRLLVTTPKMLDSIRKLDSWGNFSKNCTFAAIDGYDAMNKYDKILKKALGKKTQKLIISNYPVNVRPETSLSFVNIGGSDPYIERCQTKVNVFVLETDCGVSIMKPFALNLKQFAGQELIVTQDPDTHKFFDYFYKVHRPKYVKDMKKTVHDLLKFVDKKSEVVCVPDNIRRLVSEELDNVKTVGELLATPGTFEKITVISPDTFKHLYQVVHKCQNIDVLVHSHDWDVAEKRALQLQCVIGGVKE